MTVEVLNRSSLSAATTDDIRRNLLTQLAVLGDTFRQRRTGLGELCESRSPKICKAMLWVAEIRQGCESTFDRRWFPCLGLPRYPSNLEVAAMVLRRTSLVVAAGAHSGCGSHRRQSGAHAGAGCKQRERVPPLRTAAGNWNNRIPIAHSRPWPRDLRGRLVLRKKNNLFDAYLPGVHCRSSASRLPAMTCCDSDESWPIGAGSVQPECVLSLPRATTSAAHYRRESATLTTAPAFYSAAPVPRDQTTSWLLAAVDGQVHLLDGSTDQVVDKLDVGQRHRQRVRSGCGSGWQVLATGSGDGRSDAVRAFEVSRSRAGGRERPP